MSSITDLYGFSLLFTISTGPCLRQNGGCSQVCITKYENDAMTKVCECQLGYKLDTDQKSCKTGLYIPIYTILYYKENSSILTVVLRCFKNDISHGVISK
jgi:hypothetical protein